MRLIITLSLASFLLPTSASAYVVKRTDTGLPIRWTQPELSLEVGPRVVERFGERDAVAAALIGADAWRGLGGPDVWVRPSAMREPYAFGTPGSQIVLQSPWTQAPLLLGVTVTTYEAESGRIVDSDILINPSPPFALLDEMPRDRVADASYDLAALLSHETGHLLGLGETDSDPLATMWPRIGMGDTHQRTVTVDDELGIQEAYAGAVLAPTVGCGGAHISTRAAASPFAWAMCAAICLFLLHLAWRRRNEMGASQRGTGAGVARPNPSMGFMFAGALLIGLFPQIADDDRGQTLSESTTERMTRAIRATSRPADERAAQLDRSLADPELSVRRAALIAMRRSPAASDRERVEPLLGGGDSETATLARDVAQRALRAPPLATVDPGAEGASAVTRARWAPFATTLIAGAARVGEVSVGPDGLFRTRVEVEGHAFEIPGGCLAGLCQMYGETILPMDFEPLVVAPATGAWARVAGDRMYGGWLGRGPAVRMQ